MDFSFLSCPIIPGRQPGEAKEGKKGWEGWGEKAGKRDGGRAGGRDRRPEEEARQSREGGDGEEMDCCNERVEEENLGGVRVQRAESASSFTKLNFSFIKRCAMHGERRCWAESN